jgi:site-specific recombinase XerD
MRLTREPNTMSGEPLSEVLPDFELYLEAGGKSNNTILMYMRTASSLADFVGEKVTVDKITHRRLQAYLVHEANKPNMNTGKKRAPAYIKKHARQPASVVQVAR